MDGRITCNFLLTDEKPAGHESYKEQERDLKQSFFIKPPERTDFSARIVKHDPISEFFPNIQTTSGPSEYLQTNHHLKSSLHRTPPKSDSKFSSAYSQQPIIEIGPRSKMSLNAYASPPLAPVILTPSLLESLHGLKLPQAAKAVGISITTFKHACRRLGIPRWQGTRGPGRRRPGGIIKPKNQPGKSAGPSERPCTADNFKQEELLEYGSDIDIAGLADGCRALEKEWLAKVSKSGCISVSPSAGSVGDEAADCRDDKLLLEMLAQPWP